MALKRLSIDLCHQSKGLDAIAPLQREKSSFQLLTIAKPEKARLRQKSGCSEKQLSYLQRNLESIRRR